MSLRDEWLRLCQCELDAAASMDKAIRSGQPADDLSSAWRKSVRERDEFGERHGFRLMLSNSHTLDLAKL
ncbi:hypothetical protein ACFSHT_22365 [Paraburkholderia silviterrae]|uniref:Uncharacterized protein n=1 Tax=Paraburkholderia silviterrae TaxID=2528715 RepID=A0A4V2ZZL3_9BURK|nr:hypothetical protein [Paraburkholderia silviterrae]TDG25874.1 hypothetical protein EYW47_00440 [Paraburkholderia silviterrae]